MNGLLTRRNFIRGGVASTALAGGGLAYGGGFGLHWVEVKRVRLDLGLGRELRVVALSDLHFDPLHEVDFLRDVMAMIAEVRPDVFVITGDLISRDAGRVDELASILGEVSAPLGRFVVLGNHDIWTDGDLITRSLEDQGIRVLRNECVKLPGFGECYLSGLDSFWAGEPDASVIDRTPERSRHVLLIHEPDPFDEVTDPRVRLQISGHTHGGQVRLPFIGALVLPKWGENYDAGLFQKAGRNLYVNRGLGSLSPHVRFLCRPEVTVFELG
ncbi:MAG: metallophosphoesterase [Chthoniobacterales bacterium]